MDLHEYGQYCARKNSNTTCSWRQDFEMCEALSICYFCNMEILDYTSKNGYTYKANKDKSPHRKNYECVNNWSEYNQKV